MVWKDPAYDLDETKSETSSVHEAFSQISRLARAWDNCNYNSCEGNLEKWRMYLNVIWRELSPDAKIKCAKGPNKYALGIEVLNKAIRKARMSGNRDLIYKALHEKDRFLRMLADDVGKGAKREQQFDDAFTK